MHLLHLGILRDVVASCLLDMLQSGDLHRYTQCNSDANPDIVLHRIGAMAQNWAKHRKIDLSIKPLTLASLSYNAADYPELESAVKASRTRYLFELVCKVCLEMDSCQPIVIVREGFYDVPRVTRMFALTQEQSMVEETGEELVHAQVRASMCWALSTAVSIWSRGSRPYLTPEEADRSTELGRIYIKLYSWLASEALARGQLLWKLRPKYHYMQHMLDEVERTHANPMSQSNFLDEDHMKRLRGATVYCHPGTVKLTWARRYVLKRVLTWRRLQLTGRG